MKSPLNHKNKVSWRVPTNIALVKYWGKVKNQIPKNPSLSITLENSFTETSITYHPKEIANAAIELDFYFDGHENPKFKKRIEKYFTALKDDLPFLTLYSFKIESRNSFPHSSGIASSASSMASLALCLMSIHEATTQQELDTSEFFEKASHYARLGSGSASRSVFGGFSIWGEASFVHNSSNTFAIPFNDAIHPAFQRIRLAVMLVSSEEKEVSSSQGHALMHEHPFAEARFEQANRHLSALISILQKGNREDFFTLVENEALSLHAMMMTSKPSFLLLKPNSLNIIEAIQKARNEQGLQVGFTIDAGANIHVLYFEEQKTRVHQFIDKKLLPFCENKQWIDDKLGNGPQRI